MFVIPAIGASTTGTGSVMLPIVQRRCARWLVDMPQFSQT